MLAFEMVFVRELDKAFVRAFVGVEEEEFYFANNLWESHTVAAEELLLFLLNTH